MSPITIDLPWPPSTNGLFVNRKSTRQYGRKKGRGLSPVYLKWRAHAEMQIMASRLPRLTGPVSILITLHPPDSRPRDASNYIKALEDSLVRMKVIADDRREVVQEITSRWGDVAKPSKTARAVVTITPISGT